MHSMKYRMNIEKHLYAMSGGSNTQQTERRQHVFTVTQCADQKSGHWNLMNKLWRAHVQNFSSKLYRDFNRQFCILRARREMGKKYIKADVRFVFRGCKSKRSRSRQVAKLKASNNCSQWLSWKHFTWYIVSSLSL